MNGYFKFSDNGRVAYRLHVADFDSVEDVAYPIPDGYTSDNEYALINGVVVNVGLPPTPNHDWNGEQYVLNSSKVVEMVQAHRASLLLTSDWTQLPDVPIATQQAWVSYRQALRDITDQPNYPFEVEWPTAP